MFILMEEAYQKNRNLIFDRSHIGEYVYGPLYRNYSGDYIFDIEKLYVNKPFFKDIFLFIFVDSPENLIKREDGLSFSTEMEMKIKEIQLFKEYHSKSNIMHKYLINVDKLSIDDVHKLIKDILNLE
jgi:thymidylate kinase